MSAIPNVPEPLQVILESDDNERQPLLRPKDDRMQPLDLEAPEEGDALEGSEISPEEVNKVVKRRTWWTYLWWFILFSASLVILALFIKGFIDADDVEVRGPYHLVVIRYSAS